MQADFVVVGMGTAGCEIASMLSQHFRVIGIEAGGDLSESVPVRDPSYAAGIVRNYNPVYFWQQNPLPSGFLVKPDPSLRIACTTLRDKKQSTEKELEVFYTAGKLIGGTSAINIMHYVTGTRGYWEKWRKFGWSPREVYTAYREAKIPIRQSTQLDVVDEQMLAALEQMGIQRFPKGDYNAYNALNGSFGRWQLFQYPNGERASADTIFLPRAKHLRILPHTTATRIIFEGKRAVGVKAIRKGESICIRARKEVILCCGIYSAELLQRSGVGPRKLLSCLGIPIVVPNAEVGRVFWNHPMVSIPIATPEQFTAGDYFYGIGAFLPPLLPGDDMRRRGYQLVSTRSGNQVILKLLYLQPRSRGRVLIQSADPLTTSLVDNNTFGVRSDMQALILGIREYVARFVLALHTYDARYAFIDLDEKVLQNDAALDVYIREHYSQTYHWTGTNRIGKVVDGKGRVYGTKGLRVADFSIAPVISDGNTCAPTCAIARIIGKRTLARHM